MKKLQSEKEFLGRAVEHVKKDKKQTVEPSLFANDFFKKIIITKEKNWISVRLVASEAIETFMIIGEKNENKFYKLLKELRKL